MQALALLYHVTAARAAVDDRFFRAAYGTLLAPGLAGSQKVAAFLALVFKALKDDVSGETWVTWVCYMGM